MLEEPIKERLMISIRSKLTIQLLVVAAMSFYMSTAAYSERPDEDSGLTKVDKVERIETTKDQKNDRNSGELEELKRIQGVTMHHMFTLATGIEAYKMIFGECPEDLNDLLETDQIFVEPERMSEYRLDGWGREFYFYSSGMKYILISFGGNGIPDQRRTAEGYLSNSEHSDADIVFVDGEFAQFPVGFEPFYF